MRPALRPALLPACTAALLEYFEPLMQWLDEQNRGRECGWN